MTSPCSLYKPEYCAVAIEILGTGKSYAAVCAKIGVCRDTIYEWRDKHPEFAKALKIGIQQAQAVWEDIGTRGITGEFDKFGGSPWMFTMKNRFRDDYKDDKTEKPDESVSLLEKIISGQIKISQ